jgi:exonuclease III
MKLNLLTFNSRGLNKEIAVASLHQYIQQFQPRLDIVAIQEHKLRGDAFNRLSQKLWRNAMAIGTEASPGYGHNPGDARVGCGGIVTLLAPQWSKLVSQIGTIHNNKVHWFILAGLPKSDVGIANVYAPNDSTSCYAL